jgi:hypothetical protein
MRISRRALILAPAAALAARLCAESSPVKGLRLDYRNEGDGPWNAFIRNNRPAAATAYIAQATFRLDGRQQPTAFGGDSLAYLNGGLELAPSSQTATGNSLPAHAVVLTTGFIAVIYADGVTEGDEDVVTMLLSGRHRALADLRECVPALEKVVNGEMTAAALAAKLNEMKARDLAEAARLDDLITVPGVKHRYFMGSVPTQTLPLLQAGGATALLPQYREWIKRLESSKPDIR